MTWQYLIYGLLIWLGGCGLFWLFIAGGAARKTIDECEHGVEPEYCNECGGHHANS